MNARERSEPESPREPTLLPPEEQSRNDTAFDETADEDAGPNTVDGVED